MSEAILWPHQERVFDLVASGSNVILHAPTGSGKTRAALYPFLTAADPAADLHGNLPRKCIYSVPMRVLAKQFVEEYSETVRRYNLRYGLGLDVTIQTGDRSTDPILAADLIFATIDQTLSSFLLAPYGLRRGQANLNAAAVAASYLVFDEFHLYDPISTLPTTLHMLRMLKGITPFVLMTATFSATLLEGLAELLDAVVLPGTDSEHEALRTLESQQKTRWYHVAAQPLTADQVLDVHEGRSLVICNTVDRARWMHDALFRATAGTDTRVLLLHSRFLRADRNRIEDEVRARFGKEVSRKGSVILVSTQAIEVGVDITCTQLHTELAPANAILQRAGRCARYRGEEGDVTIYPRVLDDESGDVVELVEEVAPYMQQENEFARTLAAFLEQDGTMLDFSDEQKIVSYVHGPRDQQMLDHLRADSFGYRHRMYAVMRGVSPDDAGNLIREIKQQAVTIHPNPDDLLEAPFDAPSFGLHPGTVQKYAVQWLERYHDLANDDIPWAIKWLRISTDEAAEQGNRVTYSWEDVYDDPRAVWGAPLVVVHPRLAAYSETLGFLPDMAGDWQAELPPRTERPERERHTYRLETYERHIELVYAAAFDAISGFWHEMVWLARRLEQQFGWEKGSLRQAAELAVLLHDVGKLSVVWQGWVRDYQAKIGEPVEPGQAYAHTELQTERHREIEQAIRKRPWHAVEGAITILPTLGEVFGNEHPLTHAVFSAVARHHAPYSDTNKSFRLIRDALKHIESVEPFQISVQVMGLDSDIPSDAGAIDLIADPERHTPAFLAYELLVRVLRRADQLGTAVGTGGR
jgi:CRISPR-associated endonuclease/helicase Cas3